MYLRMDPRAPSSTIGRFTLVLRLRCRRAPAARILSSRSSQRESATRARSPPSPATVTCVNGRIPSQQTTQVEVRSRSGKLNKLGGESYVCGVGVV